MVSPARLVACVMPRGFDRHFDRRGDQADGRHAHTLDCVQKTLIGSTLTADVSCVTGGADVGGGDCGPRPWEWAGGGGETPPKLESFVM